MILNPEKLNNTEEERKALAEIIRQCIWDYLHAKYPYLRSTTHDSQNH